MSLKPKDPWNILGPGLDAEMGRAQVIRQEIFKFEYGPERRKLILELIGLWGQLGVNRKHCLLTNIDKDLQLLIKKKVIVIRRQGRGMSRTTYVELRK